MDVFVDLGNFAFCAFFDVGDRSFAGFSIWYIRKNVIRTFGEVGLDKNEILCDDLFPINQFT